MSTPPRPPPFPPHEREAAKTEIVEIDPRELIVPDDRDDRIADLTLRLGIAERCIVSLYERLTVVFRLAHTMMRVMTGINGPFKRGTPLYQIHIHLKQIEKMLADETLIHSLVEILKHPKELANIRQLSPNCYRLIDQALQALGYRPLDTYVDGPPSP